MPFENVRGLHADRFFNSPGTLACIRSGQANLLLFAISEGAETPHASIHPFLTRLSVDSFPILPPGGHCRWRGFRAGPPAKR